VATYHGPVAAIVFGQLIPRLEARKQSNIGRVGGPSAGECPASGTSSLLFITRKEVAEDFK